MLRWVVLAVGWVMMASVTSGAEQAGSSYDDLVALFTEWREFERPTFVDGVPDCTADAMAAQQRELATWQRRLETIDRSDWPVSQQVDYHLVRAEMNGLEYTIEEATEFAAKWTPRGWMPADSNTVWGEQHLYLAQPGYGTSYLIGKIQLEQLMAERARDLGDEFTMRGFMDDLTDAGVIPVSLVRWELTGPDDQIRKMTRGW